MNKENVEKLEQIIDEIADFASKRCNEEKKPKTKEKLQIAMSDMENEIFGRLVNEGFINREELQTALDNQLSKSLSGEEGEGRKIGVTVIKVSNGEEEDDD